MPPFFQDVAESLVGSYLQVKIRGVLAGSCKCRRLGINLNQTLGYVWGPGADRPDCQEEVSPDTRVLTSGYPIRLSTYVGLCRSGKLNVSSQVDYCVDSQDFEDHHTRFETYASGAKDTLFFQFKRPVFLGTRLLESRLNHLPVLTLFLLSVLTFSSHYYYLLWYCCCQC